MTPLAAWLNVWRLVNLGSLTIIISAPSVSISVGCTLFGNLWCGWLKFNWVATKPYQNIPEPSKTLHCCCSELWMIRLVGWFLLESSQKTKLPVASVWTSCFLLYIPYGDKLVCFRTWRNSILDDLGPKCCRCCMFVEASHFRWMASLSITFPFPE